jgi:hypothetical protein
LEPSGEKSWSEHSKEFAIHPNWASIASCIERLREKG